MSDFLLIAGLLAVSVFILYRQFKKKSKGSCCET